LKTKPYTPAETVRRRGESYSHAHMRVLNNFFMRFPVGNDPHNTDGDEGLHRRNSKPDWNVPSIVTYPDQGYSEKKGSQTPAEFFAEVDRTVAELGIEIAEISRRINRWIYEGKKSDEARERLSKEMWDILIPVYIALRKKGYSRKDLW